MLTYKERQTISWLAMLLKIVQKMRLLHSAFYNKWLILLSESQWICWSYLKYNKFIRFIFIILYIRLPLIENIENNMAAHNAFFPMLKLPKIQYIYSIHLYNTLYTSVTSWEYWEKHGRPQCIFANIYYQWSCVYVRKGVIWNTVWGFHSYIT